MLKCNFKNLYFNKSVFIGMANLGQNDMSGKRDLN